MRGETPRFYSSLFQDHQMNQGHDKVYGHDSFLQNWSLLPNPTPTPRSGDWAQGLIHSRNLLYYWTKLKFVLSPESPALVTDKSQTVFAFVDTELTLQICGGSPTTWADTEWTQHPYSSVPRTPSALESRLKSWLCRIFSTTSSASTLVSSTRFSWDSTESCFTGPLWKESHLFPPFVLHMLWK